MFGRNNVTLRHRQQVLDELAESYGHLKLAAGHAAGGAAEHMTPTYDRAREAASRRLGSTREALGPMRESLGPMYEQMARAASDARREKDRMRMREQVMARRRRWPMLMSLLAVGAAVGAIGAVMARKRRATAEWDEYDPMPSSHGASMSTATKRATESAATVADRAANQAGKLAGSLHERATPKSETPFAGFTEDQSGRPNARPANP